MYEYDAGGRLVRSVTRCEPEFTGDQVALLLASHAVESEPRGSHGVLMSEATDIANQWRFKASRKTDWAAKAVADAAELLRKQYPDGNTNGHVYAVTLKD